LALIEPVSRPAPEAAPAGGLARASRRVRFGGEWVEAEVLRGEPEEGTRAGGPCVFELPESTLVLPPAWGAKVDAHGTVVAGRVS
jgi:N-methylhydantoinase A/oxoprolinase/acetone carboxylase beta subunit